jgi:hypothetical protein
MFIRDENTKLFGLFSNSQNVDVILLPCIFMVIIGGLIYIGRWLDG